MGCRGVCIRVYMCVCVNKSLGGRWEDRQEIAQLIFLLVKSHSHHHPPSASHTHAHTHLHTTHLHTRTHTLVHQPRTAWLALVFAHSISPPGHFLKAPQRDLLRWREAKRLLVSLHRKALKLTPLSHTHTHATAPEGSHLHSNGCKSRHITLFA